MKDKIRNLINIENDFFDLDNENKIANMKLEFETPDEIFDKNSITKIPIFSDDFSDWLKVAFEYTPKNYKINLDISFNDFKEYTEDDFKDIFIKNTLLEFNRSRRKNKLKNRIAYCLIFLGILFFVIMLLLSNLWKNGGLVKDIFSYMFDIATTVMFWEAATILIVENAERRNYAKSLIKKFGSIDFHKKL